MEAFQLRLWDGRLGRWLSPDPYGQYDSPYLGIGNNPVNLTDPDAGCTKCPKNANVGDSFSHSDYGDLAYSIDGKGVGFWSSASGNIILNDVVVTGGGSGGLGMAGDIALGFVPGSGIIGMYQHAKDGNWGQFAMSTAFFAFDVATLGSGSILKGGIKAAIKVGAKQSGKTIIGETMERVSKEALQHPGAVTLNNMPKFKGNRDQVTSQMMTHNRKWILEQMRSGRPILDIGLDAERPVKSIFYQMEQNMIKNYHKLHPNTLNVIKQ